MKGVIPRDAPPPDYFSMMRALYAVGDTLNQIAQTAQARGLVDAAHYGEAVQQFEQVVRDITAAVILPQKMGPPQSRRLSGDKERPRSDEPFTADGKSDKRREP